MESNNLNAVEVEVLMDGKPCDYTGISLRQSMTSHHVFEIGVSFRHDKPSVWEETVDEIIRRNLGKQVAINITHIASGATNEFVGVITDVEVVGIDGDKGSVRLHGGSPTIVLDRDPAMDSFTDYNLSNIVDETIEKSGLKIQLLNNPESDAVIPYVCRYRETTYGFLSRILSTYGEWFYYDGNQLVVGNPHDADSIDVSYDMELSEVRIKTGLRNLNVEMYGYNPAANEYLEDVPPQNIGGENLYTQVASEASEPLYPTPAKLPAGYQVQGEKDIMAAVRTYHSRNYSQTSIFTARCKTCGVKVGGMATAMIPDSFENVSFRDLGRFRVLEVHHTVGKDGHYENTFTGVAGLTEALPADHIEKPSAFPEPAIVIANDDPNGQGRIQVRFLWQPEDKNTNWIRVQTPDAGNGTDGFNNRGMVFIPEVDDQVMVGFQYGDPNRPYVMGSLFHKDNSNCAADNNAVKSLTTRSGSTLRFTDLEQDNAYKIELIHNSSNGIKLTVSEDKGTMVIETTNDIYIKAPELIQMEAKQIVMLAETIQAKADDKIEMVAQKTVHLESADGMELLSKEMSAEASAAMTLKAKEITGKASSSMALNGGSKMDVKAGTIKMNQ